MNRFLCNKIFFSNITYRNEKQYKTQKMSTTQLSIQTVKTQTNLAQTASSLRYFKPKLYVLDYGGVNNFQLMALIKQQLFSTNKIKWS